MASPSKLWLAIALVILVGLACSTFSIQPTHISASAPTPTTLPSIPIKPGVENPDEPVFITGEIPYTSPFFMNTLSQSFVMLEDEAGFVRRDREFKFPLVGQTLGPVQVQSDNILTYALTLPAIPQGIQVDVNHNGKQDIGVQVFAIAYWSNTWGNPFLEERDGTGWSTAYASTITDPENKDEIIGGTLIVWAPNDQQSFPTGFGKDHKLFTEDDPIGALPPGYNLVDLNQEPFRMYKEAQPKIALNEGVIAVNDFSQMSYADAFNALFEKVSREYPFTADKGIDWQALKSEFIPRIGQAQNSDDFYRALRDFTYRIPDGHVNISLNTSVLYEERGGGFGLVLAQLSDGRIIVTSVLAGTPGELAGIQIGAEIITWNKQPVSQAVAQVIPYFGPYSTEQTRHLEQINFLSHLPPGSQIELTFKNPGDNQERKTTLQAVPEYDSLFKTIPSFNQDELALPVEGKVLDGSGLGYIRITTFSDDYNLMARAWERYIQNLIDHKIPGLIIDLRSNNGGAVSMVLDFAGYFFNEEFDLYRSLYFNDKTVQFEYTDRPARIKPAPQFYEYPVAVLVSPNCISACEVFAYALQQKGRSIVIGHFPTAGAFGEVGRGQYKMPSDISMQFPTGRPETLDGKLLIEGRGVIPDITVPVTVESALGKTDAVLQAAIRALLDKIK
jgi:carboxyl-terminal processing protease